MNLTVMKMVVLFVGVCHAKSPTEELFTCMFPYVDLDKNGLVDERELDAFIPTLPHQDRRRIKSGQKILQRCDMDGNNGIDIDDMRRATQHCRIRSRRRMRRLKRKYCQVVCVDESGNTCNDPNTGEVKIKNKST